MLAFIMQGVQMGPNRRKHLLIRIQVEEEEEVSDVFSKQLEK